LRRRPSPCAAQGYKTVCFIWDKKFSLHSSLFAVLFADNLIKADTAPNFGADMSVLVWVSLPKLRLTQLMEKMVNSLTHSTRKHADRGFTSRLLSDMGNYRGTGGYPLRETQHRLAPMPAGRSLAFSHHHKPMHEGKIFQ